MASINLALAQMDFPVGAIDANLQTALQCLAAARADGADLILFPELALTGYPPEDLLLRPGFLQHAGEALTELIANTKGIDVLIGHPWA